MELCRSIRSATPHDAPSRPATKTSQVVSPSRSGCTFRRTSIFFNQSQEISQTRTCPVAAGSHSEELRARLSRVPRDHALRRGRHPGRVEPRGASKLQFPQIRHELRHRTSRCRRSASTTISCQPAVVGIRLAQLGRTRGSLVGEISLEEMWRMVDRIRVGDQGYALVVAGERTADRAWQLQ